MTVPEHQHQNITENCGRNFKFFLLRLFHYTPHAPFSYWCYGAEFLDKVRRYWSKSSLSGKSGYQMIYGETPDISQFRFLWFQPIWYYLPNVSFPQDKMEPRFFLDVADNTGAGFSYVILPTQSY